MDFLFFPSRIRLCLTIADFILEASICIATMPAWSSYGSPRFGLTISNPLQAEEAVPYKIPRRFRLKNVKMEAKKQRGRFYSLSGIYGQMKENSALSILFIFFLLSTMKFEP